MPTTKKKPKKLSRKARRRGRIYCAPACGLGCTWAKYQAAKKAAKKLAKRMGKGWKPHVWENLGWHYKVISPCGRLKVHPNRYQGRTEDYSAFLGRWAEHGRTPKKAVQAVVAATQAELAKIQASIAGLEGWAD